MDVRDAVAGIVNQLPKDMEDEPRVVKADADATPIMQMSVSAAKLSEGELTDLVNNVIEDKLAAVEGVAAANSYGLRAKTIEVRVNQTALAGARHRASPISSTAIGKAAVTAPSGALENATQQLLVRAEAPVATPEDVGDLEINAQTKVKDVAFVRWGFQEATAITRLDGKTAIGVDIIRQAQANTIDISEGVRAAVDELRKTLPAGVDISITRDDAIFIRESVREVIISLLLANVIVILIILAFLRSFRATIAPAISIPVSLIGTLAAIWAVGFSINVITLLALVVATGLVVDDAIVVIENIARHRAMGAGPRAAAVIGTKQIVFAVLATTATLAAVFIPVSFMPGIVGSLFSEFGFVLAFSVSISAAVALTVCPMLASKFGTGEEGHDDNSLDGPRRQRADQSLHGDRRGLPAGCAGSSSPSASASASLGFIAFETLKQEITPAEDRGVMQIRLTAQQGANLDYMSKQTQRVEDVLAPYKQVGRGDGRPAARSATAAPTAPWSSSSLARLASIANARSSRSRPSCRRSSITLPGLQISLQGANSLGIRGGGQGLRFAIVGPELRAPADDGAEDGQQAAGAARLPQRAHGLRHDAAAAVGAHQPRGLDQARRADRDDHQPDQRHDRLPEGGRPVRRGRDRRDPGDGRRAADQRSVRPAEPVRQGGGRQVHHPVVAGDHQGGRHRADARPRGPSALRRHHGATSTTASCSATRWRRCAASPRRRSTPTCRSRCSARRARWRRRRRTRRSSSPSPSSSCSWCWRRSSKA